MTAEDNGVPEDDDPFAYLYRGQEGEDAARNAAPQPGVPRTSYQQATQVGRTQYGQPRPQQGPPAPQYQQQYTQPFPQQGQPGQPYPGQQPTSQLPPAGGGRAASRSGGGSGGGSNRAVTFGAIGVVLAVAIGIGVAVVNSGGAKSDTAGSGSSPSVSSSAPASVSASASAPAPAAPPGKTDVDSASMTLGGGAVTADNHTGGASTDGKFVPLTSAGMSITWNNVTVPSAGSYTFWVHYANAGASSTTPFTLTINGKAMSNTINLENWAGSNNWDQAWQRSYASVPLNAGSNSIELSYGSGSAGVNVDQFAVTVSPSTPPWS
ncbi:carbohydrate-binding protein [Streptacidiphilus sp. PB12-B1b]|uniref:carbohydrate-binding protein n=1 Tax=Streptacidiphilus sp. PB12-B1b TaxID=2705012 RepID=UPI0015FB0F67|nr:carbohydrate-binding protein [Streptacidiphilus sp. PB12-B1b]QMU74917.1 carbohydrate-binding protein [Streptacidiphilus sp. PB12-B1b]